MKNFLFVLILISILSACNSNNEPAAIVTVGDNVKIDQAVELFILSPDYDITDILWTQTEGEPVVFLAYTSKVIAFTPTMAGTYSFNASYSLKDGTKESIEHSITVSSDQSYISARLGHAVLEGNKVSLRASITQELSSSSLVWKQITGPEVDFTEENTDGNYAVFFDAPEVSQDTLLEFSVTSGSHSDNVGIIVENAESINTDSNDTAYTDRLARVFPFVESSPYADVLADCVYSNKINFNNTCTFNTLPLIAHDTTSPSVDDIMDRVVVSHHWMGQRFREFLENFDPNNDFKNLLRANTAIVISYDIRPSYYWVVSGAIHLDANYFWLTPDERDTINQAPDYRASFG